MPSKPALVLEPLDETVDHVRGPATLIGEHGDDECPCSRAAGEVHGTPTISTDGAVHRAGYDTAPLLGVLAR